MSRLIPILTLAGLVGCNAFVPLEETGNFEPKPLPWDELPVAPDELPTVLLDGHAFAGVYVADKLGGAVLRYHRGTGEVLDVLADDLDRPVDVLLDHGTFYVATMGGLVHRFDAQTHEELAPLLLPGVVVEPGAVLIRAGELFVLSKGTETVFILDLETGAILGELKENMREPHDMRMGPDGLLYVTHEGDHRVQVWNPDSAALVREIVSAQDVERPSGLAFHDDELILADLTGDNITRFDAETGERMKQLALVSRPQALEVSAGLLYVSTIDGIQRFTAAGDLVDNFAKTEPGGLRDPRGLLVVDPS
jgi:WD40 repeat protein